MSDQTVRRRVERLLQGERRSDDLTRIFMYVRDRTDGRESVQEIGDFVAHQNERIKGLVTRSSRTQFKAFQFQLQHILEGKVDATYIPSGVKELLLYNLNKLDNDFFRKNLVSRRDSYRLVESISKKLVPVDDGRWTAYDSSKRAWLITDEENMLFNKLIHVVVSAPVFTGEELYRDIKATLKSNGLLMKEEMREFDKVSPFIQLYAVSVMNGSTIVLQNGSKAYLQASTNPLTSETVTVSIEMPVPLSAGKSLNLGLHMFTTNLKHTEHCHEELLDLNDLKDIPLEVKDDGKLGIL